MAYGSSSEKFEFNQKNNRHRKKKQEDRKKNEIGKMKKACRKEGMQKNRKKKGAEKPSKFVKY
jgi:hypothetical protein